MDFSEIKRQKNALNRVKQQELVKCVNLNAKIVLALKNPIAWAVHLVLHMTHPPTSVFQPTSNVIWVSILS